MSDTSIGNLRRTELAKYDEAYFAAEYWKEDIPGKSGNHGLSYDDPGHLRRFDFLASSFLEIIGRLDMLDMGCGPGHLIARWAAAGLGARGVDPSAAAVAIFAATYPQLGLDVIDRRGLHENLADLEPADIVFCLDVLEHMLVFDLDAAISNISRLAGRLAVLSINMDNPYLYHPTILSRPTWITAIEAKGVLRLDTDLTERLNDTVKTQYVEYDFLVFRRLGA